MPLQYNLNRVWLLVAAGTGEICDVFSSYEAAEAAYDAQIALGADPLDFTIDVRGF